jgi:hypothetical protein
MTTWEVRPGSIAAACYASRLNGETYSFVYLSEESVEVTLGGVSRVRYTLSEAEFIPLEVRESVKTHFDHVFSLPYDTGPESLRHKYMEAVKPWKLQCQTGGN